MNGPDELMPGLQRTWQPASSLLPIHRELLLCELTTRRRPVLTWWRARPYTCDAGGHIVTVSDLTPTFQGELVLILDPWPVDVGDRYWLDWMGYTCGYKLGGHCVDYYDIQGGGDPPDACNEPTLDTQSCEARVALQPIVSLAAVAELVASLLTSQAGPRLQLGLGLPASVTDLSCAGALLVHSAWIDFAADDSASLTRLGSSRLVCQLEGETWRSSVSIFLVGDATVGWRFAGFGATNTSQLIQQLGDPLVSALPAVLPGGGLRELYEVEVPGTGTVLLVDPTGVENPTVNLDRPSLGRRGLSAVLTDPVAGEDSPSLEKWLRSQERQNN